MGAISSANVPDFAFDVLPQGILVTDSHQPDNPIVYANPAFERLTGYGSDEIIGRNCRFLQGPGTSAETVAELRAAVRRRAIFHGVILNFRKDGARFWNELTVAPVLDPRDLDRFFVGVQCDVTRRLELEERLREAQKMEALGKLSGGISHDFNNLLALILGNAETVADALDEGSPAAEAVSDIIEAAEAGASLISRMLDFSCGRTRQPELIDVDSKVLDVISLLSRTIREPVSIIGDLASGGGKVFVDSVLFETALINLVLNARDAMPHGGTIGIRTRRRFDASTSLAKAISITVADDGIGMNEEAVRRAFEPYFTTKGPERGTGLGLSMVYGFIKQSGGESFISSRSGEGTQVELLLPEHTPRAAHDQYPIAPYRARILLVEDEAKVRSMIAQHLSREGYAVDEAGSVAEAFPLIDGDEPYGVVVSDIRLPGGPSGIDLIEKVRARDAGTGIILITGFADELESAGAVIDGVQILRKPFRRAELAEAVRQLLA